MRRKKNRKIKTKKKKNKNKNHMQAHTFIPKKLFYKKINNNGCKKFPLKCSDS